MMRQSNAPLVPAPNLHGQRVRAALVGETAYVVGLPQLLAEPRVVQVTPCVDSDRVLIAREVYQSALVPGAAAEVASELQLLLYSARRRRTTLVFRYQPAPGEVARLGMFFWWVGGESASFSLMVSNTTRDERRLVPLVLNLTAEKVTPIAVTVPHNTGAYHMPSPTQPFALLVQVHNGSDPGRVYRVQSDGSATVSRNDDRVSGFLPDGESALLEPEENKPNAPAIVFHFRTGKEQIVPPEKAAQLAATTLAQAQRDQSLATQLPLRLVQRVSKGEPPVSLLYLAPQKPTDGEETLLLAGAEPAGIARDLKTLFYYQQGQLYLAPLQALPRRAFLEERDRQLRELTLRRAKQLAQVRLMAYYYDHNNTWPPVDTLLDTLFKSGPRDLGVSQNPLTERDDLRFEYDGVSAPLDPRTRVASLGGPGGRAVVYGDGQVRWEPTR